MLGRKISIQLNDAPGLRPVDEVGVARAGRDLELLNRFAVAGFDGGGEYVANGGTICFNSVLDEGGPGFDRLHRLERDSIQIVGRQKDVVYG